MTKSNDLSTQQLRELATAFQGSRVLLTAFELGVFSALAQGATTSEQVARQAGTDARATDRLMNALCVLGLLEKRDGQFFNTRSTDRFLVRGRPEYMSGIGHTAHLWHTWSGLTDSVRHGRPAEARGLGERGDDWTEAFIAAMHYRARTQAEELARTIEFRGVSRLLDVGGGSGAFALTFARHHPELEAVVFDLPAVVPITERHIEAEHLGARVRAVVGDYMADALPGGFDLVFLSAIIHSNPPRTNQALTEKCAGALRAGGRLVVVDWLMDDERVRPAAGAMFALNMLVGTQGGDTFTAAEVHGWMEAAGLSEITIQETSFGSGMMIGRKAG